MMVLRISLVLLVCFRASICSSDELILKTSLSTPIWWRSSNDGQTYPCQKNKHESQLTHLLLFRR